MDGFNALPFVSVNGGGFALGTGNVRMTVTGGAAGRTAFLGGGVRGIGDGWGLMHRMTDWVGSNFDAFFSADTGWCFDDWRVDPDPETGVLGGVRGKEPRIADDREVLSPT